MGKRGLSLILLLITFFLLSGVAYSFTGVNYWVVAEDNTPFGKSATGTNGYNYVMADPTTTNGHISSLYVRQSGNGSTFAEVGWCSEKVLLTRQVRYFAAKSYNGSYLDWHFEDAPLGTNHYYTVRHITGTTDWGFWVDGVLKKQYNMNSWTSGWSTASSERGSTGDTNYSHFWSLRYRDANANWVNWSNLTIRDTIGSSVGDNDPNYNLRKVSNTECFMEI